MDRRRPLLLAASLLAGAAGCSHFHHTPELPGAAVPSGPVAKIPAPEPAVASNGPKQHRPESWVAYASYAAQEAAARDGAQAERIRETARKAYQEALRLDPNCLSAHQGLGRLYVMAGDQERAAASYQAALKLAPKEASLWYELGMGYARFKAWGPAVENLTQAAELDPENRQYVNGLGFVLARAGRYQEALTWLSRYNGEAKGHYQLARMLEHVKQPDLCKAHLRMALEKDPEFEDARRMLARLDGTAPAAPADCPPAGAVQTVGYRQAAPPAAASLPAAPPATRVLPPPPSFQARPRMPAASEPAGNGG
jgi:tetratricopeptide (TPR) repeat protein